MELKGQMIHVPESFSLMFLGSPRVDKLEELMGRGLYLSDIPIHDATRDVILVGEQARAQDGLKKRMDKLKVKQLPLILVFFFLPCTQRPINWFIERTKTEADILVKIICVFFFFFCELRISKTYYF